MCATVALLNRSQKTEIELELQPTELRPYHQEDLRLGKQKVSTQPDSKKGI